MLLTCLWLVSAADPPWALAEPPACAGVAPPTRVQADGRTLLLNGIGVRRVSLLGLEVFVGALYLPVVRRDAAAILVSDQPKRLSLWLKRDAPRDRLVGVFRERLGRTAEVDALAAALPTRVRRGDRLAFTHLPRRGLEVRHGDRVRAIVGDDPFARSFFAMFLGEDAVDGRLRRGLLEGGCP